MLLFVLLLLVTQIAVADISAVGETCPVVELSVERLPDLNIPRTGHATFCVDGQMMVIGGHTSGFVPTATAEFFHDGEWQQEPTVYAHDQGLGISLASGVIIVAGGHQHPLGIGQTFPLERCNPVTRTFEGYGCLYLKRSFAQGIEMDSSHVIITGSWYSDDGIECYDGSRQCVKVKDVAQDRSEPYVLKTSADNAIIFSNYDIHGEAFDTIIVDRLHGEPFIEPLLQTWRPFYDQMGNRPQNCFIGDESRGEYAWLLSGVRADGQIALLKVEGEHFSLLPTTCPVPMSSRWGHIRYFSAVVADRQAQRAYITGYGPDEGDRRVYVLCADYSQTPAVLTLYCSEPQGIIGCYCPVLTGEGDLLMAGGINLVEPNNYTPQATALLLKVGLGTGAPTTTAALWWWLWVAIPIIIIALAATVIWRHRHRAANPAISEPVKGAVGAVVADDTLVRRLCQLMDSDKPYLDSDLKLQDIADRLHTNRTYIIDSIKADRNQTFTQFINTYRVEYAKQQLTLYPDKKMSLIATESGFTTDVWFFRTFKAITGITPNEWRLQQTERLQG